MAIGSDAVRAWVGPSAAAQDFVYLSAAVEVKTVSSRHPQRCQIGHERQLDATGLGALFLVHQVIASGPEGLTLVELVDDLRDDPFVRADLAWFENSLLEIGWLDVHRGQYMHDRYALQRRRCLSVREGFPRLVHDTLPLGVSAVSYLLDLSSCSAYGVDEEVVRNSVMRGGPAVKE
jgi:hypothetical protein